MQETILHDDGSINADGARFCEDLIDLDRFDARSELIRQLEDKGLYRGSKREWYLSYCLCCFQMYLKPNTLVYIAHEMRLGLCSRSGDVVEPLLKPQWFISLKRMASIADEVVRSGQVEIQPAWQKAEWHRWLDDAPDCECSRVL